MNIGTKYLGLDIQSPIVAASCGLTSNLENLKALEGFGVGAVVLKSIFEEEIIFDIKRNTHIIAPVNNYGVSYDYISQHVSDNSMRNYLNFIGEAKRALSIPVVSSIHCYSYENWVTYAKLFQDAGCDALEINMSILPYEVSLSADDVDRTFGDIVRTLKKVTTMPIAVKVSPYFTDAAKFMQQLSWMGIQGITMFNKSMLVDIDIDSQTMLYDKQFSAPSDIYNTLRWVSILSKQLRCGISASTGVYYPEDVVKLLLAGAETVQVASCLYKNGLEYMRQLNDGLVQWMQSNGYDSLDQFRGKLAMKGGEKNSLLMRTQFMDHYDDV